MAFFLACVGRVGRVSMRGGDVVVVVGNVGGGGGVVRGGRGMGGALGVVSGGVVGGAWEDVVAVPLCGVAEAFVFDSKVSVRDMGCVEGSRSFDKAFWEYFIKDCAVVAQDLFGCCICDFPSVWAVAQ